MKFCLIGCGNIAETMHAPSYMKYKAEHPEFQMAACCDPIEERAKAMQRQVGFERCYTNHQEMIRLEKPDVAAVIVSEPKAVSVGLDVLRAGIPMLIEKPPGRNYHDTLQLAEEAQKRNVPCQVAFNRRFMPVLVEMRKRKPEKTQLISYEMFRCERKDSHFSNTAVHAIDAVRYLADADYARVRFDYQEMSEYGEGVCNIFMDCEMTSGIKTQIRICPMSGVSVERAAIHSRGRFIMGYTPVWGGYDAPGHIEDFCDNKPPEVIAFEPKDVFESNGFFAENVAFFDAIANGKRIVPDISAALNTMQVKECIDMRKREFKLL